MPTCATGRPPFAHCGPCSSRPCRRDRRPRERDVAGRRVLARLRRSFTGRVSVVRTSVEPADENAVVDRLDPSTTSLISPSSQWKRRIGRRRRSSHCGAAGVPTQSSSRPGSPKSGSTGSWTPQDEVLAAARGNGMRIVGPNCLGVVSTTCGLNATFTNQGSRPVESRSRRSRAAWGSPLLSRLLDVTPVSRRSCRWVTRSTSAGTICCDCGPTTTTQPSSCCTSSRSAIRVASPGWPAPRHGAKR